MSVIKRWSTGSIGNVHPDHSDRGNPNTKGLSYNITGEIIGPGIEGYIEEDEVIASSDNRPLKNLVENDVILDTNLSDVASEVDHGIFKNRYNEFELDIQSEGFFEDPEIPNVEILTTPLRINSGSSIINGRVTRIGNQRILYFLRDDDSLVFPEYIDGQNITELKDDDYFGDYRPVYTTISEELPSGFESYEIRLSNKSTENPPVADDRTIIYKAYRDWEEITPLKAESESAINEIVDFQNDINFGQFSEGYWLASPKHIYDDQGNLISSTPVPGTHVSDVEISKDIIIRDKLLEPDRFEINSNNHNEYEIITDGIFFNDIQWSIDSSQLEVGSDIQDMYVHSYVSNVVDGIETYTSDIYFIVRSLTSRLLYLKKENSTQLQYRSIIQGQNNGDNVYPLGLKRLGNYLFFYGTKGFLRSIILEPETITGNATGFNDKPLLHFSNFDNVADASLASENINDIYYWKNRIWIAGDSKLWYSAEISKSTLENITNYDFFTNIEFNEYDINSIIRNEADEPIIKKLTKLEKLSGNIIINSAINGNIYNLLKNTSLEEGIVGTASPGESNVYNWNVYKENASTTTTLTLQEGGIWGNYRGVITADASTITGRIYQDYEFDSNAYNRIFNFSTYLQANTPTSGTIQIQELDSTDTVLDETTESYEIIDITQPIRPELAHRISDVSGNTKKIRVIINSQVDFLYVDGAQLEEIDNTGIEITDIEAVADNEGSLASKFFYVSSPFTNYYVWYNVDNNGNGQGDSIDPKLIETSPGVYQHPELQSRTGVEVLIQRNATAIKVAENTASKIHVLADLDAYHVINTIKLSVNSEVAGDVVDARDINTGFTINVAVQGLYQASEYVENWEYLFVGLEKVDQDRRSTPFFIIDAVNPVPSDPNDIDLQKQCIHYPKNMYGEIRKINDVILDDSNRSYIVDDKHIYSLTFLNNYNEYDRFTIVDIATEDNDLNFEKSIHRFETIEKFGDRILFGGTVANQVIRLQYNIGNQENKLRDHTIEIIGPSDTNLQSFTRLMGSTTLIHANNNNPTMLEWDRVDSILENPNTQGGTEEGYYKPDSDYGFRILIDGEQLGGDIIIHSPDFNNGPWEFREIVTQIDTQMGNELIWFNPDGTTFGINNIDWTTPVSSSSITDGFYSIGRQDITRHVRGNIHKIFVDIPELNRFFIARGSQIFQSKYDPNVKKIDGEYPTRPEVTGTVKSYNNLPKGLKQEDYGKIYHVDGIAYYEWTTSGWEEYNYYTKWDVYNDDITLKKYKHVDNIEKTFRDTSTNKVWIDLPVEPGYKLQKGSIRFKTNNLKEVGFTEGLDYHIDYENSRIIRSDGRNWVRNPDFSSFTTTADQNNYNDRGQLALFTDLPTDNTQYSYNDYYYIEETRSFYRATSGVTRQEIWQQFENIYTPSDWNVYDTNDTGNQTQLRSVSDIGDESNRIGEFIVAEAPIAGDERACLYQTFDIDYSQKTFTFSVNVKSYNYSNVIIRIAECNSSNINQINYNKSIDDFDESNLPESNYTYTNFEIGHITDYTQTEDFNKWHTIQVSHALQDPTTTNLRVEIWSFRNNQLFVDKAQLEQNLTRTPFIIGSRTSRIDPNMHIWVDFIQWRELEQSEYSFDVNSRIVTIYEQIHDNEYFYFQYKYKKIFNPYDFGNSKPVTSALTDDRDDYFILKTEGRIWAINQMFAMMSLEVEDPLLVTYKYHYPRVDQIKIRNVPDRFGNFVYIVKGKTDAENPYKPYDIGTGYGIQDSRQYYDASGNLITDIINTRDNDVLYEINVISNDYKINDIYDRRIYIDARDNLNFNISLLPETVAYFPFKKDFFATNGMGPLTSIQLSKIIPIIKNYSVIQLEEVGAWRDGYQLSLRTKFDYPRTSFSVFVDPINGSDSVLSDGQTRGFSESTAFKTVQKAVDSLYENSINDKITNIVITTEANINENIEIDKQFTVSIVAKTYCYWSGAIQNKTPLNIMGVWFLNTAVYPLNNVNLYYCTFENSSINCISPQFMNINNTEFKNCHNSIVRVKNVLFPSPFYHPYQRVEERNDNINTIPESVATSDYESIAPGDTFINVLNQTSNYVFRNCLIYGTTDKVIEFDPDLNWSSNFTFDFCTIANNRSLFTTPKYDLSVLYSNSILFNNRETRGTETKIFDSNSTINFASSFIDFPDETDTVAGNSTNWNFKVGDLVGRSSCIGKTETSDPQFVGETDYHLKSIAKGSITDSIALERGTGGLDLGCYSEIRQQTEQDIPRKLKSYVADINEGIKYPVKLNSEKITVTMEFKPKGNMTDSGIIFDTRSASDEEDYIVLAYNNNDFENHSLIQDETNPPSNPYRFRIIVANRQKSYSIISPIEINTDEDFQAWHRISFTINYEKIINTKPQFSEKDKQQNIIILYHNELTSIESFVKYDLNRYIDGELIPGLGDEGENAWNYNDICSFITFGSAFDGKNVVEGYYDELRIDNKFIDRKQFELWNVKKVQFNDPVSYVNQAPLTRSFETIRLNEYWSLKSEYDIGAKGNKFLGETRKRISSDNGETAWFIGNPTDNLITNSKYEGIKNAYAEIPFDFSTYSNYTVSDNWEINVDTSRLGTDSSPGITINTANSNHSKWNGSAVILENINDIREMLELAFDNIDTLISWRIEYNNIIIYSQDFVSTTISVNIINQDNFTSSNFNGIKEWVVWNSDFGIGQSIDNFIKPNYDRRFNRYTENSIAMKNVSGSNPVRLFQNKTFIEKTYTFSAIVYYDKTLKNENIQFYFEALLTADYEESFDTIERLEGNWWRLIKTFSYIDGGGSTSHNIGVSLHSGENVFIDAMQLEQNRFASPFTPDITGETGQIAISSSLINKEKGTIFFKFKPVFEFTQPRLNNGDSPPPFIERTIFEIVSQTNAIENTSGSLDGFKAIYYFNENKNRGIIEFSINDLDDTKWKLEIVPDFFYQWHSIGIVYDYPNNRFIYWFDYFNNIIDRDISDFTPHNLYIGRSTPLNYRTGDLHPAADIYVKDIIIQNYPVSDSEIQTWGNVYEFFNESIFYSTLDEFRNSLQNVESSNAVYSELSSDLVEKLDDIDTKVDGFETSIVQAENNIQALQDFVGYAVINDHINHELRIVNLEQNVDGLENSVSSVQADINAIINGSNSGAITDNYNLVDIKDNFEYLLPALADEISDRAVADQAIRDDLSSNTSNRGASLIGVDTSTGYFSAITVQNALTELGGDTLTKNEDGTVIRINISSNYDKIVEIEEQLGNNDQAFDALQDGNTGNWNEVIGVSNKFNVYSNRIDINDLYSEIDQLKDNNSTIRRTYTNIDLGSVNTLISFTTLVVGNYAFDVNGTQWLFFNPNDNPSYNDILNLIRLAQDSNNNIFGQLYKVSYVSDGLEYDLRIEDRDENSTSLLVTEDTSIVDPIPLFNSLGATIGPTVSSTTLFDPITMNAYSLRNDIDSEVQNRIDGDQSIRDDLSISNTTNLGSDMISINDVSGLFLYDSLTNVLQEIAGLDKNQNMTVSGNYTAIQAHELAINGTGGLVQTTSDNTSSINGINSTLAFIKDGVDGSAWDAITGTKPNLVDHESRISDNETDISNSQSNIIVNTTSISNNTASINSISNDLSSEITNRINGDSAIRQDLADTLSGKGASLIGIEDATNSFTASNVEDALEELESRLSVLAGSISWKEPVATYSDLPVVDNSIGDTRTISDDGDGKQAQYTWDGTRWIKIADIDWGQANNVAYDNTITEIPASDIQSALDYIWLNNKDNTKAEGIITSSDWNTGSGQYDGMYYADVVHDLGTQDIVCLVMNNGFVIGVEDIDRLDNNRARIYVADNTLNLSVTIFGVVDKYSVIINQWTPDGQGAYYKDINHGFDTQQIMTSTFDVDTSINTGWLTGAESIEILDNNSIRVKTTDATTIMNVFILKKSQISFSKDVEDWVYNSSEDMYEAMIPISTSYDAVYSFFDPVTGKTIGIDMVQISSGQLTLRKSNNSKIRMVIIQ